MFGGQDFIFDLARMATGGKSLQPFIDASAELYNKLETDGFPFAPHMQMALTFEQVSREYGMNAMATVVDIDSDGTPITAEGEVLQTGKIPRMKKWAAFDEEDFRKLAIKEVVYTDRQALAQDVLFDYHKKLIDAITNSLTFFRHQMVSTNQLALTSANNAGGVTGTIFSASIPTANVTTLIGDYRWWSTAYSVEGTDSDPIGDLQAIVAKAKAKGKAFHFEADALAVERLLNHSAVVTKIGYTVSPLATDATAALAIGSNLFEDERKQRLERLLGVKIKVIDSISRVDKFDKSKDKVVGVEMRSFNEDNWALVPDGKIGEIIVAKPIAVGNPSNFATHYDGRLLLTNTFDERKKIQRTDAEMTALVVPEVPQKMYLLKTR